MVSNLLEAVTLTEYAEKLCGTYRCVYFVCLTLNYIPNGSAMLEGGLSLIHLMVWKAITCVFNLVDNLLIYQRINIDY